jgi:hypothetical protein
MQPLQAYTCKIGGAHNLISQSKRSWEEMQVMHSPYQELELPTIFIMPMIKSCLPTS